MTHSIYFLSIPLPKTLLEKIQEWKAAIPDKGQIKWVGEEKLHITILFFGKIEKRLLPEIEKKISRVLQDFDPFELNVTEAAIKKLHNRRKNMLWLRLENHPEFNRLYSQLKDSLEEYADFRPGSYNSHITLARHVDKTFRLDKDQELFESDFTLNSIELMESNRSGPEVSYLPEKHFSLGE